MHETRDGYRGACRAHSRLSGLVGWSVVGYVVAAEVLPRILDDQLLAARIAGVALLALLIASQIVSWGYLRATRPRFCGCTLLATWHVVSGRGEEWSCCSHLDETTRRLQDEGHGAPVTATRIAHAEYPVVGPS